MAKKQTFLMVSLEDDKAKKLAQVISNDTSRKILEHLSQKKATESELAKDLDIPISTVHYNLKHLMASKLVESGEFHYSEKGKEVAHYSLANKYVIIAPKGMSEGFRDKLKNLIPVGFLIAAGAGIIHFATRFFTGATMSKSMEIVQGPVKDSITESAMATAPSVSGEMERNAATEAATTGTRALMDKAGDSVMGYASDSANQAAQTVSERVIHNQTVQVVTERIVDTVPSVPYWAWFVIGAAAALILYLGIDYLRKRR